MNDKTLVYLIIVSALVLVLIFASSRCSWECTSFSPNDDFTVEEQQAGKSALQELEEMISRGETPPEISEEELNELSEEIYIVKLPTESTKEKLSNFPTENTRYWPYNYYSFPYNYKYGGAWPPGMYSRLRYWSPGYYMGTGWSYYMRPGMGYKYWPRNRWIRNTQDGKHSYYYLSNRDGLMKLEESIIKKLVEKITDDSEIRSCMEILETDWNSHRLLKEDFARVSYTKAIKILMNVQFETHRFEIEPKWGIDLGKEHERYLCEEHFKSPTFVYGYPSEFKSFYMLQCEPFIDPEISEEPLQTCESVDLLVSGIGELCGGSTREYRYDILREMIKKKGLKEDDYAEYLSLRKQGTFPHGGFGMGFDRLMMWLFDIDHIRDLAPFPRYYHC